MTTVPICRNWAGRVVDGKFPLLEWLGGCEGCGVFLTERQGLPTERAVIKLIPAEAADADNRVAGWRAAQTLQHPLLLRLYEYGRCQIDGSEFAYVVTEYGEEVLADILPERALTPDEAHTVLESLVEALEYLHGKGFVHGRLKPSKVMAVKDQLKLSVDHLLRAGAGSRAFDARAYDAPDLALGKVSPAADIWSLGVTLVEMLTQRRPEWDRKEHGEPTVPKEMPEPFAGIAKMCLRIDPAERCTLREIRLQLKPEEAVAAKGITEADSGPVDAEVVEPVVAASVSGSVSEQASPRSKTWIRVVGILGLVTVMAVAWYLRPHPNGKSLASENPGLAVREGANEPPPTEPVTVKGTVVKRVPPEVLPSASATIRGTVRVDVQVTVDSNGNVADAVYAQYGPSRYFANAAMKAAKAWEFNPAQVNGRAVRSVWLLKFGFTRTANQVTATEMSP